MRSIKAALYCRISKEEENKDESESIINQRNILIDYCKLHNLQVYDIYEDADYSGIRQDRPEFLRLISDAEEKKFDIVLCKTMSRFSRDITIIDKYVNNIFPELGIRFISLVDNADSFDRANKKTRQINSLINEWYLEDLSENIRAVFKNKMKKGECLFAFPPYGYKKDRKEKNHLVADEKTQYVVKYIFYLYCCGYGAEYIAKMLNEMNVLSPLSYRNNNSLCNWSGSTVSDILKNPVYTGDMVQNRKNKVNYKSKKRINVEKKNWITVENTHAPIISREIFYIVEKILSGKPRSMKNGRINPLNSLVYCTCGNKCLRKNNVFLCKECKIKVEYEKINNSVIKKIGIKDFDIEEKFLIISAIVDRVVVSRAEAEIWWKG